MIRIDCEDRSRFLVGAGIGKAADGLADSPASSTLPHPAGPIGPVVSAILQGNAGRSASSHQWWHISSSQFIATADSSSGGNPLATISTHSTRDAANSLSPASPIHTTEKWEAMLDDAFCRPEEEEGTAGEGAPAPR